MVNMQFALPGGVDDNHSALAQRDNYNSLV